MLINASYLTYSTGLGLNLKLGFGICKLTIRREAALVVHLLE